MEMDSIITSLENHELEVTIDKKDKLSLLKIKNIGVLRLYHTKKGTSIDYSQLPAHFKERIMDIVEPLNDEKVIGVDEAGKGDYFGPMVAVAAYVEDSKKLRAMGVVDSKRLKDEKIIILAEEIKKKCPVSIVKLNPERYNSMQKDMNLNSMLAWCHAKAIENLLKDHQPDYVLSDKFADESVLQSKLGELGKQVKLVQRTKAESNTAVAAASIVARAEFVLSLQQLSFKYGMELPLGAGKKVDVAGKIFIKQHSKDELVKVAKLHFITTQKIT